MDWPVIGAVSAAVVVAGAVTFEVVFFFAIRPRTGQTDAPSRQLWDGRRAIGL